MKKHFALASISLILFVESCKEKNKQYAQFENTMVFHEENKVILEENSDCLIGEGIQYVVNGNKLYLWSLAMSGKILTYDLEGKFLFSFGRLGHGPGEFSIVTELFPYDKGIAVYDRLQNLITIFDEEGKYIKQIRVKFRNVKGIAKVKTKVYFYILNTPEYNYNVVITDTSFANYTSLIPGNNDYLNLTNRNIFGGAFYVTKDKIVDFNTYTENCIRYFNLDGILLKTIPLPGGKYYHWNDELKSIKLSTFEDIKKLRSQMTDVYNAIFIDDNNLLINYLIPTEKGGQIIRHAIFSVKQKKLVFFINLFIRSYYNNKFYSVRFENSQSGEIGKPVLRILKLKEKLPELPE